MPVKPDSQHHDPTSVVSTRERLVAAMLRSLRRKGYHAIGLNDLLVEAGTPKGVLYHHFPGGKSALAVAAIESMVMQMSGSLQLLLQRDPDPVQVLGAWMGSAQRLLAASGFEEGCPLATIALESSAEFTTIREALANGFTAIRHNLCNTLVNAGVDGVRARNLATLFVSAYEGALMQARVAGQVDPMRRTTEALMELVRLTLPAKLAVQASAESNLKLDATTPP